MQIKDNSTKTKSLGSVSRGVVPAPKSKKSDENKRLGRGKQRGGPCIRAGRCVCACACVWWSLYLRRGKRRGGPCMKTLGRNKPRDSLHENQRKGDENKRVIVNPIGGVAAVID